MMTSETSIISRLPVISGRKLSRPWTSAVSLLARATSWPVLQVRPALLVEREQVVVHLVAQVVLHGDADQAAAVAPQVGEAERRDGDQRPAAPATATGARRPGR